METRNHEEMQAKIQALEQELKMLQSALLEKDKLEEQLRQAQKMQALAHLAGGIAHDFNNVLQNILGLTQLALAEKTLNDSDYNTFLEIQSTIEKGKEITQQFLTFGRKTESKFMPLDLNRKLTEVRKLLLRTIPKMIEIELKMSDDLKMVNADEGQIEQLLMNLGINSRDAMPDGGKLILQTENLKSGYNSLPIYSKPQPGEYVSLSISDTGSGMAPKIIEHMYEPFFSTKEKGKGIGLGLSMVYAIVKNHDGLIDCSSKVGEGTTFRIYLPVLNADLKRSNNKKLKTKEAFSRGNETILIVDDELSILDIGKEMLQKFGYKVITSENGEGAIHEYSRNKIDLVILDIGMPGMGGIKCLQELVSIDQKANVIISSGYLLNRLIREAVEIGAKAFLPKPYSIKELLNTVRQVLDGKVASQASGPLPKRPESLKLGADALVL